MWSVRVSTTPGYCTQVCNECVLDGRRGEAVHCADQHMWICTAACMAYGGGCTPTLNVAGSVVSAAMHPASLAAAVGWLRGLPGAAAMAHLLPTWCTSMQTLRVTVCDQL